MRFRLKICIILSSLLSQYCFGQIDNSVLSEGEWYKVAVSESGVYSIDQNFFQRNNINIGSNSFFHVYSGPIGVLPEPILVPRVEDLIEIPLLEHNGEYLVYLEAASIFQIRDQEAYYQQNIYDENNYVFIKIDQIPPLLLTEKEYVNDPEITFDSYLEIQRYEVDKINPLGTFPTTHGSGQEWYGDEFSNLRSKDYSDQFDFSDRLLDSPLSLHAEFVGRSSSSSKIEIVVDDQVYSDNIRSVRVGDIEAIHARKGVVMAEITTTSSRPSIELNYPTVSTESKGWLDFIQLSFERSINIVGEEQRFLSQPRSTEYKRAAFQIDQSSISDKMVLDITSPLSPVQMEIREGSWSYNSDSSLRRFVLFDLNRPLELNARPIPVENQNLHGIVDADMVIVYDENWTNEAERLADHRSNYSELNVHIVEIGQIYNEFSSGRQDPTAIRDFARMLYQRSENFRYLLLFGDGSYDYRGIDESLPIQSMVPTYETAETLDPLEAFPSDDYFAQLDEDEGVRLRGDLDIAVGRAPVRTREEAEVFVNKVIAYDTNKDAYGAWRSRIAFLADDEDSNLHLNDADVIAKKVRSAHPTFNQRKIYWDAFLQESTPGGNRYPGANSQLNNDIEDGLLVVNYLGHGGPKGWSQERVLNLDDITAWSNSDRLPLVITATCSFTGFDDPSLTTAGEATMHNPSGGAVALFTTVRSVYASQNFRLTSAVFDTIFTKVNGEYMTIGEVMQSAKNTRINDVVNARKFFLIGDPSMKLAIPAQSIKTVSFNNKEDIMQLDTIGATKKVSISAQVVDFQGNVDFSFNGNAEIVLFDKASEVRTLRNDVGSFEKSFDLQTNVLFKGSTTVTEGEFQSEFIVPLDIDYDFGTGRISYYAVSNDGRDASGFFENFVIGGTSSDGVTDNNGPEVNVFIEDFDFKSGDKIESKNPLVIVHLTDESGINVSNVSIGHEITSILDDNTSTTRVLNSFYEANNDDFTRGSLSYRLENLEIGLHTLTIRAFDVFNNPGTSTITFEVTDNTDGKLKSVMVGPNPFRDQLNFFVENEAEAPVDVQINIYNSIGQLIETISRNGITTNDTISDLKWDVTDNDNSILTGLYYCEVILSVIGEEKTLSSGLKKVVMLK